MTICMLTDNHYSINADNRTLSRTAVGKGFR